MKKQKIILASQSPRRKYLLEQAGIEFTVIPSGFDEDSQPLVEPELYVRILAKGKAEDIASKYSDCWVIGADTIVLIHDTILGKPASRAEAGKMLAKLSGQTHKVLTGYCICCKARKRNIAQTVVTGVRFKDLSQKEIEWYIHTKEPFDKAGAYAIQGLGTFLVKSVNGSYTNVVGLPVCEVIEFLIKERVLHFAHTGTVSY